MKNETELKELAEQINNGDIALDDVVTELTFEDCKFLDDLVEPDEYDMPPTCEYVWNNDLDEEFLKSHTSTLASAIFFDQMTDSGYGCGQNTEAMLEQWAKYLTEADFKELAKGFYNDLYCGDDENERSEEDWYNYFKSFAN